ncbi:hypothetical protein [Metabacillus sp. cB07]|uniref:hypothetical protein n=1 Tax=Metabacillus sp. cB07 TaxID=2806989 RepID=UPI00193A22D8|nr:hypothetical protein [Metabacillus sp. cB07]
MGFDVVLYNRDGCRLKTIFEVSEELHSEIFHSKKTWRSYLELRKLSDYYLTDENFSGERLSNLISDLINYKVFIPVFYLAEYEAFIDVISKSEISEIHIGGD